MKTHCATLTQKLSQKSYRLIFFFLTISAVLLSPYPVSADTTITKLDIVVTDPFGWLGSGFFGPRYTYDGYGNLIENTDFGIKNPDLGSRVTCFNQPFNQLWHAGEDLYWNDRSISTDGFAVFSIAAGTVMYAPTNINYPGSVVIIRHSTSTGYMYSVYAHINPASVAVTQGQNVTSGTYLGSVMYQEYSGDFPQYHQDLNDSHLHFEIRNFYDSSNIYSSYPSCNITGNIAGKGYTYPQIPDQFPNSSSHYSHQANIFLNTSIIRFCR
jgi:hypothetical protein